ncbi:MAG: ketol-acid reductoisomerase, partial [Lutimonas sp.]
HACKPLLEDFMKGIETDVIGVQYGAGRDNGVDNRDLIRINEEIRYHMVEVIGSELRESMTAMTKIV